MVDNKASLYHLLVWFKDVIPLLTAQEICKYPSYKWGGMVERPRVYFEIQNEKKLV